MMKIERALISVTDKKGVSELAGFLAAKGVEILASGGTARAITESGVEVTEVSGMTGFPEIMNGRVKTLHPRVHGGILADRSSPEHMKQAAELGIGMIDLVVVNLYRFRDKVSEPGIAEEEAVEEIDIGGPTLIRSAAKNFKSVAVVVDPEDYGRVMKYLKEEGALPLEFRRELASKAFHHTAAYDTAISDYFEKIAGEGKFPEKKIISLSRWTPLRYGENPHLEAALYRNDDRADIFSEFEQLQGKKLSYNNIGDMFAAFLLAADLGENGCAVNKHMSPCGAAVSSDTCSSFIRARKTDPMSAFGSIVAVNGIVDADLAEAANEGFVEVMLARGYTDGARELFSRKKNMRLILIPESEWERDHSGVTVKFDGNLVLMQQRDTGFPELEDLNLVTSRKPEANELKAMKLAWKVVKHVRSNAIVICDEEGTLGIGAGQMSRVDSCRIAVRKAADAGLDLRGSSAGSDAFFPFPDGVRVLVDSGVVNVVQPGGSIRDKKVIEAAEEMGITMALTGRRHFKH
ncbi:MAG: bifunctional phosphoribosylaminoimidazolecarboxamide formyltransferase/IMP cyclohydrolase [Candidatus Latescibacteria bacterium]|nr:bifunctional phosphoribosylaminoimidazolecarboxamide formyltransferase/IMP cyclohydrolase [bacterium]MBD3423568.1 bifunctional phosphoribosylaminoimidazolecarboxamide formyltransferase/IMP cyclohydrolase [Candidatus Latescibacterota bacterium]